MYTIIKTVVYTQFGKYNDKRANCLKSNAKIMNITANFIQQYNTTATVCETVINSDQIALLTIKIILIYQPHVHYFNTISVSIHTDAEA